MNSASDTQTSDYSDTESGETDERTLSEVTDSIDDSADVDSEYVDSVDVDSVDDDDVHDATIYDTNDLLTLNGIADEIVRRGFDRHFMQGLYCMNGLFLFLMIYCYTMIRSTWSLVLFMNTLVSIQIPVIKHRIVNTDRLAKKHVVSYGLRSALYYAGLTMYVAVISLLYYRDSLFNVAKVIVFGLCPSLYAMLCVAIESVDVGRDSQDSEYSVDSQDSEDSVNSGYSQA